MSYKQLDQLFYWDRLKMKKLSQKKLAVLVNENEKTFCRLVKTGSLSEDQLKIVARALGVRIEQLWRVPGNLDERYKVLYEQLVLDYRKLLNDHNQALEDLKEKETMISILLQQLSTANI